MANEVVLIVDDNPLDVKLVRDLLQYHGFGTLDADSAEDGLALATAHRPSLILTDVRLPDADGLTLLAQLQADASTASIPVVAVTALAMPEDEARLLAAGFSAYLSKPIDVRSLIGFVRTMCQGTPREVPGAPRRESS